MEAWPPKVCARCKRRSTGATPILCFPCFKALADAFRTWHLGPRAWAMHEELLAAELRRWRNYVQKKTRQALRRHAQGLLAEPPERPKKVLK